MHLGRMENGKQATGNRRPANGGEEAGRSAALLRAAVATAIVVVTVAGIAWLDLPRGRPSEIRLDRVGSAEAALGRTVYTGWSVELEEDRDGERWVACCGGNRRWRLDGLRSSFQPGDSIDFRGRVVGPHDIRVEDAIGRRWRGLKICVSLAGLVMVGAYVVRDWRAQWREVSRSTRA